MTESDATVEFTGIGRKTLTKPAIWIAVALCAAWIGIWLYIEWSMYSAFNLTIWDLGISFNYSYRWLLGQGALQPQALDTFLFVPIVALFPDSFALAASQTVLMGVGGLFVYLIAMEVLNDARKGLVLLGLYLFSYALFGGPFFPGHAEVLFPSFFPIAFYAYLRGHRAITAIFLVLSAAASDLSLVIVVVFWLVEAWPPILRSLWKRQRLLPSLKALTNKYAALTIGAGFALAIFLLVEIYYGAAGVQAGAHLTGGSGTAGIAEGFTSDLRLKILYFALLLLPFGTTLFRTKYVLLLAPYSALVIVSPFTHYADFAYQYTFDIGVLIFLAFIVGERSVRSRGTSPTSENPGQPKPTVPSRRRILPPSRWVWLVSISIILGFVILPYAPLNQYAGAADENYPFWDYNLTGITHETAVDSALNRMASLVPMDTSVLIQENMPQLTNRFHWFEPGDYNGTPLVKYILTDPYASDNSFTFIPPSFIGPYPVSMVTWVNKLYQSYPYGIRAEYEGAMLLEQNFAGAPSFYAPLNRSWSASAFAVEPYVTNYTQLDGVVSFTNASVQSAVFSTEKNVVLLSPGSYQLVITVKTSGPSPGGFFDVTLSDDNTVPNLFAGTVLGSELKPTSSWQTVTLNLSIDRYVLNGYAWVSDLHWGGTLSFASISLVQSSWNPVH